MSEPRVIAEAVAVLGTTPREGLEWLLDQVVYAELADLGSKAAGKILFSLRLLTVKASNNPKILPRPANSGDLRDIQKQLREALEELVAGRPYSKSLSIRVEWEFEEPLRFDRNKALTLRQ
jgi:hypothetical protein